ncbi:hypothetical protein HMPREF3191_01201 [Veillonellaceae bacterium DNF00626]|nr:hypothetical protein HMPREF3191_01201 [Veillonellaceae bacterium DNF00626]
MSLQHGGYLYFVGSSHAVFCMYVSLINCKIHDLNCFIYWLCQEFTPTFLTQLNWKGVWIY